MKTTLDINDTLLAEAKAAFAAQQRTSLTRLIEGGLQLRLRAPVTRRKRTSFRLPVFDGGSGLVGGVDALSNKAMLRPPTMTPDVNVLVAASRADHPQHAVALAWLEDAAGAAQTGATLTLLPMVLASFVRLVTHPRIFQQPTPIDNAIAFVDALLASVGVRVAPLGPEWLKLRALCRTQQLAANELPDAWLAAAVLHLDEHLVSFDKSFKKLLPRQQFTLLNATEK